MRLYLLTARVYVNIHMCIYLCIHVFPLVCTSVNVSAYVYECTWCIQ